LSSGFISIPKPVHGVLIQQIGSHIISSHRIIQVDVVVLDAVQPIAQHHVVTDEILESFIFRLVGVLVLLAHRMDHPDWFRFVHVEVCVVVTVFVFGVL
jgi:hypothetical protein